MNLKTIISKVNNLFAAILGLNAETLKIIRVSLIFLLLGDLFGVYWYLKWNRAGFNLFLLILGLLCVVIGLEHRQNKDKLDKIPQIDEKGGKKQWTLMKMMTTM